MELQYKSKGTKFLTYVQQVCQIHENVKTTEGGTNLKHNRNTKTNCMKHTTKFGNNQGAIDPKSQTHNF